MKRRSVRYSILFFIFLLRNYHNYLNSFEQAIRENFYLNDILIHSSSFRNREGVSAACVASHASSVLFVSVPCLCCV